MIVVVVAPDVIRLRNVVTFPLVLSPGQMAHVWIESAPVPGARYSAVQARYPWYGWQWLWGSRGMARTKWLREKNIRAVLSTQ